eukprot:COSAG05_NODE_2265_length_3314_cov_55.001758_5_plen_394_part_00
MLFDMGAVYSNWHRTIGDTQIAGCIHANADSPPPDYCLNHPLETAQATTETRRGGSALTAVAQRSIGHSSSGGIAACSLCCDAAVTSTQRFGCYSKAGSANQSFANSTGAVPGVVPFDNVAGWPADPAWGAAAIVIPHAAWKHTADKTAAAAAYPTMRRYAEFLSNHVDAADGLVKFGMLGDWNPLANDSQPSTARLQKGRTPVPQVSAFYGVLNFGMISDVARDLGFSADAARYSELAVHGKTAYRAAFRRSSGTFSDPSDACSQTSNVLPVVLDLVPAADKSAVWAALNTSLHCIVGSSEPAVTAGGVGTRYIFEALTRLGHETVALQIALKETFPSFGTTPRSRLPPFPPVPSSRLALDPSQLTSIAACRLDGETRPWNALGAVVRCAKI